jgi:outer membrane lipoprotein-sorting protein
MVSPRRSAHLACVLLALVFALACAAGLQAQTQRAATPEWNLPALMSALHQVRTTAGHFVETKNLRLLNQAQRSSGRLVYEAPDKLWKETTEPAPGRLTVIGDTLTIEQQGQPTRRISLQDYSDAGALVGSIRATLAGDLPGLKRHFNPTLEGTASGWTLTLVPTDPKLREMVASIRIQGSGSAIRVVQTLEADGDRTDMTVTPESK